VVAFFTIDEGVATFTEPASTSGKFADVHYIFSAVVLMRIRRCVPEWLQEFEFD